jgi:hypothetical protein
MRTYIRGMRLCLHSEPRRWLQLVESHPGAGHPPGQHPHSLYVPDLPAQPFPQPDETACALEESFAGIAEFRGGVDTWRTWEAGRCLSLDDSFGHEVVHHGDRRRSVLSVDGWHPDLLSAGREFLREVLRVSPQSLYSVKRRR